VGTRGPFKALPVTVRTAVPETAGREGAEDTWGIAWLRAAVQVRFWFQEKATITCCGGYRTDNDAGEMHMLRVAMAATAALATHPAGDGMEERSRHNPDGGNPGATARR
jgi:hypothetical protein